MSHIEQEEVAKWVSSLNERKLQMSCIVEPKVVSLKESQQQMSCILKQEEVGK